MKRRRDQGDRSKHVLLVVRNSVPPKYQQPRAGPALYTVHCMLYAVRYVRYVPTVLLPSPLCQGNTAFAPQNSYLKIR